MTGDHDAPVHQSGSSEVGWNALSGGGKMAVAAAVLVGVVGLLVVPPLLEADAPAQKVDQRVRSQEAFPLDADPPRDDPDVGVRSVDGAGGGGRRRRIAPPPISISTNVGTSATTADAGSAPADRRAAYGRNAQDGGAPRGGEAAPDDVGGGEGGGQTSLSGQLSGGVRSGTMEARARRGSDYAITSHTAIPCLPREPENTRIGGLVTCVTQEWIRGDTLRRGLLPPHTVIKGQIKGGAAQHQQEIGVLYTQIETSGDRFKIDMQALGAGAMGQAGYSGEVKTFFGEQVRDVALYSLIQGVTRAIPPAAAALANKATGDGAGIGLLFNFGAGGGGANLADTALRHRLNRAPEIDRAPAIPAMVMVAVDLDFRKVCRDRQRINPMACPLM